MRWRSGANDGLFTHGSGALEALARTLSATTRGPWRACLFPGSRNDEIFWGLTYCAFVARSTSYMWKWGENVCRSLLTHHFFYRQSVCNRVHKIPRNEKPPQNSRIQNGGWNDFRINDTEPYYGLPYEICSPGICALLVHYFIWIYVVYVCVLNIHMHFSFFFVGLDLPCHCKYTGYPKIEPKTSGKCQRGATDNVQIVFLHVWCTFHIS